MFTEVGVEVELEVGIEIELEVEVEVEFCMLRQRASIGALRGHHGAGALAC
jgi:hypothetical protein